MEHYQEFVSGDGYLCVETDRLTGTTDTTATAVPKNYVGFHVSNSQGNVLRGNINGDGTLVLKVYYERDIKTVTLLDRDTVYATQQIRYGGTATAPTPPARAGYDFIGWLSGEALYDFDTAVTDNLTLTASWEARTDTPYVVEHYQQLVSLDGYLCVDTDNLTGTTDTMATAILKDYAGFHLSETASNVLSGYIIAPDTLILKVYYDRDKMDISIDLGNGQGSADIPYGGTLPQPDDPVRDGYDFKGWTDGEGNAFDFDAPITGDITLKAEWEARSDTPYLVEHYQQFVSGDGYLCVDTDRLTGTTDTMATAILKDYAGFHLSETASNVLSGYIIAPDTLILKVYYDRDKMDISIDLGNGQGSADIPYGGTLPQPDDPVRDGYDFKGWTDGEGNAFDFDAPITGDITLKAEWEARSDTEYTVCYYLQTLSLDSYEQVSTITLTGVTDTTATAEVKDYTGFHLSENEDNVLSGYIVAPDTLVLKVYYDRNRMSVACDPDDKDALIITDIPYGGTVTRPDDPIRPGYTFNGWVTADGKLFDFDTPITESIALYPSWTPKQTATEKLNSKLPSDWADDLTLTRGQAVFVFGQAQIALFGVDSITTAYDDVTEDTDYAFSITWARNEGIAIGVGDGRFAPNELVTYEQVALMLYRFYGYQAEASERSLEGVSEWAYQAVCWAIDMRLMSSEIAPQGAVTKSELVALLIAARKLK